MTDQPDFPVRAVPSGRFARAQHIGGLATGLVGGIAMSGAAALLKGQRPRLSDLVMTPRNVARLTARLSEMRGAAMKLGQLLSMEAGELLSPELEAVLARLRAGAHVMPPAQLKTVLADSYGTDFRTLFRSFDTRPLAAASIGQVHRALTPDGQPLAVKLQYPGVRAAIDSDLDNVAALIRWSGLWPRELDLAPLLAEARAQLHEEADYDREGAALVRFGTLLADDPRFVVPAHDAHRSRPNALAMGFVASEPIERLADAPPAIRDAAVAALIELCLKELFTFRVMQTDPNFANYRWNPETGQILLLDFGATREISLEMSVAYRALLRAGLANDRAAILAALARIGFIKPDLNARHHAVILDMAEMGFAVLRGPKPFDFRDNDLADRLRARGMEIGGERELWHLPPPETLFLQRKIGGLYLLATRLGARVDVAALVRRFA
ncbi:AarF/ABC1/UbiB kinase family protein [Rhodobacterales bacterium LSUCC0031]|nr:AarF/ABC1/UbiB kinase family protein [Rhodobacterales bacterium LSUCC0031]